MTDPSASTHRALILWLSICAALIFAMVIVGGVTRLTESGLSIVDWRPVTGIVPPLSAEDWEAEFSKYRASPEFQIKNHWMTVAEFQGIYLWEWGHRFLGRLIGLVFAVPLLVFWMQGRIPQGYGRRFLLILLLGAAQGGLGWFMVKSGLVDRPAVSHYRLAAHLLLALVLYGAIIRLALSLRSPRAEPKPQSTPLRRHAWAAIGLLGVTICWGAFTAGLDAGLLYPTFPLMGDGFLPPEWGNLSPFWRNFVEEHAVVQFTHRWLGASTVAMVVSLMAHATLRRSLSPALFAAEGAAFVQFGLGVSTLLSGVALPLAALHQAGAVILLTLLLCVPDSPGRGPDTPAPTVVS